ncbi:MAG: hypothetical protein ACOC53_08530 [Candidatus Saliniplasma sp.]
MKPLMKQLSLTDLSALSPEQRAEEMTEEQRIDFLREHGGEDIQKLIESVFQENKYKPKKERYWNNQLHKGKKMVRRILKEEVG